MHIASGIGALVCAVAGLAGMPAQGEDDAARGAPSELNASFNYQGRLEVDGAPANGDFFFEVRLLDSSGDEIDPRFDELGPITVVDGIFDMDVLMGGTDMDADFFWRTYGHLAKRARIGVSDVDDGSYTTLSPDIDLGSSPHALYARYAGALRFPYSDTYLDLGGDPATMFSLTNEFGGIVAEFRSNQVGDEPLVYIRGENVFNSSFGFQSGALLVDSMDDEVAIRGEGSRFSIAGFFGDPPTLPGVSAALLGNVGFFSGPDVIAVWAVNSVADNSAALGTENHAGDFSGDVLVRDNLVVEGLVEREFAPDQRSAVGPLAYGFINANGSVGNGTANLSSEWDAALNLYRVSVDVGGLFFGVQTVLVTVVDTNEPRVATVNIVSGEVRVAIWDINSGNTLVQDNFQIAIFDPRSGPSSVVVTAPQGADLDKLSEQTGVAPVRVLHEPQPSVPAHKLERGALERD
ncbi:MAG: hypothetical protein AAGA55_04000 [Planctomycetota bacterium]